jgi:hypothetical protein
MGGGLPPQEEYQISYLSGILMKLFRISSMARQVNNHYGPTGAERIFN